MIRQFDLTELVDLYTCLSLLKNEVSTGQREILKNIKLRVLEEIKREHIRMEKDNDEVRIDY